MGYFMQNCQVERSKKCIYVKGSKSPEGRRQEKLKESASHHVEKFIFQMMNFNGPAWFFRVDLTFGLVDEKSDIFIFLLNFLANIETGSRCFEILLTWKLEVS